MDKPIYDISQYDDQELYRMLDLDHPTDRELEMKIIVLLQKYQDMDNPMGRQMYSFFNDIYHHFFEDDVDETEVEAEVVEESEEVVEGFENPKATPPIIQTSGKWLGAELDILPDSAVSRGTAITASPSQKAGVASENTVNVGINTNFSTSLQNKQIGYQKSLDYTKGSLNPIIKETIQRVISIDSQFRDVNVYPYSTDFTFNLSDTLQDVVSLKLYSVQIPFTWYTVSNAYGSNFIYLNGSSPGIKGTGHYDIRITIPSGNYQASELITALNKSLQTSIYDYPDIYFGPTTKINYNAVNSRATITLDLQQIYNESSYYLEFPEYIPEQIRQDFIVFRSTPYMKFVCNHDYYKNAYNDVCLNVPLPTLDSSNNQNIFATSYGYNVSSFFSTITTMFNQPYKNVHKSFYNFSSSTINTTDISKNLMLNLKFNYQIPSYYPNDNNNIPNFKFTFVSYTSNRYDINNTIKTWGESAWKNIFNQSDPTKNYYQALSNVVIVSSLSLPNNVNINSINSSNLKRLSSPVDGSENLLNRLNQSWYDTSNNCFVDQSFNTYVIPDNTYFYDVRTMVIQIDSIGPDNNGVKQVKIPVILNGDKLIDNMSGISVNIFELRDMLNQTLQNNALQLAKNYRIYIKPNPFKANMSVIEFDTSISAILTEKDYTVSFYDTNGYPEYTSNKWDNIQNFWSKYLSIPKYSYDLSDTSQNPIYGDSSFVDLDSKLTNKIFPNLENRSLQSFLGYGEQDQIDVFYNIATRTSDIFYGSTYNSNLVYPSVDISKTYLNGSSVMDIYLYKSTIFEAPDDPPFYTTTNYSSQNSTIDSSYSITYKGLSEKQTFFTFQEIITSINDSFQTHGIFTKDTGIHIIDSSGNDVTNTPLNNFGKYYYELKIRFDRKKKKPDTNMKTYIDIHDSNTLLNYFYFKIPHTYNSNRIELSEIVSESKVKSSTSDITKPYVYLRCITRGYSGFPDNDISFTIPPSDPNIGYSMYQYLNKIESNMQNPAWGLTGIADLGGSGNTFRMGINIKHIIPATTNGQSNFTIDFSGSVLSQMNSNLNWIVESSQLTHTFDNLVFSQTYNVQKGVNDKIKIILKGPSQGSKGGAYNSDTSFNNYFQIPAGSCSLDELINRINQTVFGRNTVSATSSTNVDNSRNYIQDGRVNLYGSSMTKKVDDNDITKNKITFNFSIRSILTCNDYHLEYYDPPTYTQNLQYGPGLLDTNKPGSNYDVSNNSTDYIKFLNNISDGNTWNQKQNSWYTYLYIPDPSYLLIKQPVIPQNNEAYSCIYGKTPITDQKLWLTSSNNYLTIKPNYDACGGVFVNNPSKYNGIYSDANDIIITLDLPLNTWYNSEEIINGFNKQFAMNPVTYGSYISIDTLTHFTTTRLNVNKIFTAQDYSIVFYDPAQFTRCSYGSNQYLQTTTQDTTLGWLLGFRTLSVYNLNKYWVDNYKENTNPSIYYTLDISNNIVSITGDTSVSITLYNYFLIILNDYTQNHLNDGLVTVNSPYADISLPSYANRNTYRCNMDFSQIDNPKDFNPKDTTYIGNIRDQTTNNNLTLKQLYSANQILNTQQNNNKTFQTNMGIYVQDIFGIIPVKTSGLINGQTYVEFGGTLQNQDRMYFGPVNIKRMAIRILTDKGNILDLNNANISFSLIAQQLYNPYARG